jgi:hypothetical protein
MPDPTPGVVVSTVTIHVNPEIGSVTVHPPEHRVTSRDEEVKYEIEFASGTSNEGIGAYLALRSHDRLQPTDKTLNDGYQESIFALRDTAGNQLEPTFIAKGEGWERLTVLVLFPNDSQYVIQPTQSVVIIDW